MIGLAQESELQIHQRLYVFIALENGAISILNQELYEIKPKKILAIKSLSFRVSQYGLSEHDIFVDHG